MNRDVHIPVAAVAAFADLPFADRQEELSAAEIVGRLVGGVVGGRLPDVIDPPTHPGHRGVGHAIVPAVAAMILVVRMIPDLQTVLRTRAADLRRRADLAPAEERWPLQLQALVTEFVLGAIVGLPAGYASHLALDATTPAGLPWLAQGC